MVGLRRLVAACALIAGSLGLAGCHYKSAGAACQGTKPAVLAIISATTSSDGRFAKCKGIRWSTGYTQCWLVRFSDDRVISTWCS